MDQNEIKFVWTGFDEKWCAFYGCFIALTLRYDKNTKIGTPDGLNAFLKFEFCSENSTTNEAERQLY